jgi:pentose-5-phosphate-3-epimerase
MYTPLEKYVEQVKTCTLIVLMCVNAEPSKRPTAQDIVERLTDAQMFRPRT